MSCGCLIQGIRYIGDASSRSGLVLKSLRQQDALCGFGGPMPKADRCVTGGSRFWNPLRIRSWCLIIDATVWVVIRLAIAYAWGIRSWPDASVAGQPVRVHRRGASNSA